MLRIPCFRIPYFVYLCFRIPLYVVPRDRLLLPRAVACAAKSWHSTSTDQPNVCGHCPWRGGRPDPSYSPNELCAPQPPIGQAGSLGALGALAHPRRLVGGWHKGGWARDCIVLLVAQPTNSDPRCLARGAGCLGGNVVVVTVYLVLPTNTNWGHWLGLKEHIHSSYVYR